jgi:hypothetical protein
MAKIEVTLTWNTTGLKTEERVIELDKDDTISFKVFKDGKPASSFSFDFGDRRPFETNPITDSGSQQRVTHPGAHYKFKCIVDGDVLEGSELADPGRKFPST